MAKNNKTCKYCGKDIKRGTYCSKKCYGLDNRGSKIPEDLLRDYYLNKRLPLVDISKKFDCSVSCVSRAIQYYKVPLRGQYIDFTNQTYGNTTIIKRVDSEYGKHERWECKCCCGDIFITTSSCIKSASQNFECKKCRGLRSRSKEEITDFIWSGFRNSAKKRKKEFTITKDYAYNIFLNQNRQCALSGIDIYFAKTAKDHQYNKGTTASLDRIDSSKGYVEGNIQWVHKIVNKMKLNLDEKDFIDWCEKIVEKSKRS